MTRDLPTPNAGNDYLADYTGLTLADLGPDPDFTWTDKALAQEYAEAAEKGEAYKWVTGTDLLPEYTQHAQG